MGDVIQFRHVRRKLTEAERLNLQSIARQASLVRTITERFERGDSIPTLSRRYDVGYLWIEDKVRKSRRPVVAQAKEAA